MELRGNVNAFLFCLSRLLDFLTIILMEYYGFRIYGFSAFLSSMRVDICIETVYYFGGFCRGGMMNL